MTSSPDVVTSFKDLLLEEQRNSSEVTAEKLAAVKPVSITSASQNPAAGDAAAASAVLRFGQYPLFCCEIIYSAEQLIAKNVLDDRLLFKR